MERNGLTKPITPNTKVNYFDDLVVNQFELDAHYRNFKVQFIEIISNDNFFTVTVDDGYGPSPLSEDGNLLLKKITLERYERNGKHVTVPIATFMPIN